MDLVSYLAVHHTLFFLMTRDNGDIVGTREQPTIKRLTPEQVCRFSFLVSIQCHIYMYNIDALCESPITGINKKSPRKVVKINQFTTPTFQTSITARSLSDSLTTGETTTK